MSVGSFSLIRRSYKSCKNITYTHHISMRAMVRIFKVRTFVSVADHEERGGRGEKSVNQNVYF